MMEKEKLISLVSAVQEKKDGAATELYDAFHNDLYYYILKTVKDPELAADLTQDSFIEILQTIDTLREPVAFITWSRQIAYHKCTAYFRKHHDLIVDENEDGLTVFDTLEEENEEFIPDEALDKSELKKAIHTIINELPNEQRSAILLRYFDEMSVKEIADVQGVSEGTVKSRLNYGRKSIKQAVEGYEKKTGVRLHCAGVVPLLLWLLNEYKIENGVALTSKVASEAIFAAEAASNTATEMEVAAESTSSVAKVFSSGAKKIANFSVKKIVAGITTVAVISGGAVAIATQSSAQEEKSMNWCGYYNEKRYEITIEKMDDTYIDGHIVASELYETFHDSDFEGTGVEKDGKVFYDISFDTPLDVPNNRVEEASLTYDKETEEFQINQKEFAALDRYYSVLERIDPNEVLEVFALNQKWVGHGVDHFYTLSSPDHLFEIDIEMMTEREIKGKLQVSLDGTVDHVSTFIGRGHRENGHIAFEIKLDTPRVKHFFATLSLEAFWIHYDPSTEILKIPTNQLYVATLEKEK